MGILDIVAICYMFICWCSYAIYAHRAAKRSNSSTLSSNLRRHRVLWVRNIAERELRMSDAALLGNQERIVGFFASTTVFLLAALFAGLNNVTSLVNLSEGFSTIFREKPLSNIELEFVLAVTAAMMIFAFFKLTWSLRQLSFSAVMLGSLPSAVDNKVSEKISENHIQGLAKLLDNAGHNQNSGLRTYYYCIAMLCWIISPILFIVATTFFTYVLYRREFFSKTVRYLEV